MNGVSQRTPQRDAVCRLCFDAIYKGLSAVRLETYAQGSSLVLWFHKGCAKKIGACSGLSHEVQV